MDTEDTNVHSSGCAGVKQGFRENQETEGEREKEGQHPETGCFVVSVYNIMMMLPLLFLFQVADQLGA